LRWAKKHGGEQLTALKVKGDMDGGNVECMPLPSKS